MADGESTFEHSELFKNMGRTLATQRRRREEASISLRKQKRETFFSAKRTALVGAPLPVEGLDDYTKYSLYDDKVTEGIFSDDPALKEFSFLVYLARLEFEPDAGRSEFWDLLNFDILSSFNAALSREHNGSKMQVLALRIIAIACEESDIALAVASGSDIVKTIFYNFREYDDKSLGDVLIILALTMNFSSIPNTAEQALFFVDRCRRIAEENPITYIRELAAQTVYKLMDLIDDGIQLPTNLVNFAGDLIVSDSLQLRICGYAIFNTMFSNYRMGNAVVSSDKWYPVADRCMVSNGDESEEAFQLFENLVNFMLPYEITKYGVMDRIWYIVTAPQWSDTDKQLHALAVLTELTVATTEKINLLINSNEQAPQIFAVLLTRSKFDIRKQVMMLLRNLFLNYETCIPTFATSEVVHGISELLSVMHVDTALTALEALKAILERGGRPADSALDYDIIAEEADVQSRLDALVACPNEQVALLALEVLHRHIDDKDEEVELPDDLRDVALFKF